MDLSSPPVELEWLGWRSSTSVLQRCGWRFTQEYDPRMDSARLLLLHPGLNVVARTQALTGLDLCNIGHSFAHPRFMLHIENINFVEQRLMHAGDSNPVYTELDMEPQLVSEEMRFEMFDPRTVFRKRDSGLLVPEDTVPDLLARIVELQEPARQERLQKQVRARARDEGTSITTAKIIQFGRAAP